MDRGGRLLLAMALLAPTPCIAGQIYGSIVDSGKGLPRAKVEISCGGTVAGSGETTDDGSYRVTVGREGQCQLILPNYPERPSADVFSYAEPAQYDFELVRLGDGKHELRRR